MVFTQYGSVKNTVPLYQMQKTSGFQKKHVISSRNKVFSSKKRCQRVSKDKNVLHRQHRIRVKIVPDLVSAKPRTCDIPHWDPERVFILAFTEPSHSFFDTISCPNHILDIIFGSLVYFYIRHSGTGFFLGIIESKSEFKVQHNIPG